MGIDENQIEHIANLANLELSSEEKKSITSDFAKILAYVEKINELELDNIPETSHVLDLENVLRVDKVEKSLDKKDVLDLSPEQCDDQVKVPKFL